MGRRRGVSRSTRSLVRARAHPRRRGPVSRCQDLDTLVVCTWDRTSAWTFADLWWEDVSYDLCPRHAFKRVARDAVVKGFAGFAGVELEHHRHALEERPPRHGDRRRPASPGRRRKLVTRSLRQGRRRTSATRSARSRARSSNILEELGWGLKDVVAEGAYSQFELDFGYPHVLEMAASGSCSCGCSSRRSRRSTACSSPSCPSLTVERLALGLRHVATTRCSELVPRA